MPLCNWCGDPNNLNTSNNCPRCVRWIVGDQESLHMLRIIRHMISREIGATTEEEIHRLLDDAMFTTAAADKLSHK